MKKQWRAALWVLVGVIAVGAAGLALRKAPEQALSAEERAERIGFTMGTVARVVAEGPEAEEAVSAVMKELERLTLLLDRFHPYGDIGTLNASSGEWVEVSAEVLALLEEAVRLAEVSQGAFDPTVAPLVDLWGFVEAEPHEHEEGRAASDSPTPLVGTAPPDPEEIAKLLELVDYRSIEIDSVQGRARLARPGQAIDLGAIAKGYGMDRAVELLKARGIVRGIVDLGGDVYALGSRADGTPWRVGIRHPRKDGQILAVLRLSDAAVATSGDYERYFEYEGVRYTHIIDPRTGWPAAELASVTVVAPTGVWADALSTAVFVLGKERGLALLESLPGVDGILVDKELNVMMTSGLAGKVDLLEGV